MIGFWPLVLQEVRGSAEEAAPEAHGLPYGELMFYNLCIMRRIWRNNFLETGIIMCKFDWGLKVSCSGCVR